MIFLGLGSNLPSQYGDSEATILAAIDRLHTLGVKIARQSPFYKTRPVPVSDQPWFINAVIAVQTELQPDALLDMALKIEDEFGRIREIENEPRILDIDLLDYHGHVTGISDDPILPHPRMAYRAFVLYPLRDIAPGWSHPVSGKSVQDLIATLPASETDGIILADRITKSA